MLGGSRIIAPDGRTIAAAPRHGTDVPAPELLVADLAVDDELATAAASGGVLWALAERQPRNANPGTPATVNQRPINRRTE